MAYHCKYIEPILLDDDNKTLQGYDMHDNELLHLNVRLQVLLKVPCCRVINYIHIYR